MNYREETFGEKGRLRNGSPKFYKLLEEMAETHDKKSHDYASDGNPSGNYHFAGQMANMFAHSTEDAGFVGRIAEKIYRLANLEKDKKVPKNESIEDTERDIAVITCLWMADRRDRRTPHLTGVREVGKESWEDPRMPEEGRNAVMGSGVYNKGATSQPIQGQPAAPDYDSILRTMLALNEQILNFLKTY